MASGKQPKAKPQAHSNTQISNTQISNTVLSGHKGCALEVPASVVDAWHVKPLSFQPGRRGIPVTARAGAFVFDSHVVSRSRRYWLLLDNATLSALAVQPGASLKLNLAPREA